MNWLDDRCTHVNFDTFNWSKCSCSSFSVSEATVRNFKRAVQSLLSNGESMESIEVPERKRGRLLLPEEIDQLIKKFIQRVCASGSVSSSIVLAVAKGILTHKAPNLLKEHWEQVELI